MRWIDKPWTTIEPCGRITEMFGYQGAVQDPAAHEHLLNVWNMVHKVNDKEWHIRVLGRDDDRESTEHPWNKVVNFTY